MRNILVLTNLYPLPWEENRATFNRQQFGHLKALYRVLVLVPIAWPEWVRRRLSKGGMANALELEAVRYTWYFYTPKFGRSLYGALMFFSLLLNSFFWIRKNDIELIIGSWAYPDGVAAFLLARLLGKKFILKVHGSDINVAAESRLRAWQIKFVAQRSDGVLAVSKALKAKLIELGVPSEKVKVLYNGVDHELFGSREGAAEEGSTQILYIGNLKKEKGVLELAAAFELLLKKYPKARLLYAGAGVYFSEIEGELEKRGIVQHVELLGQVDHSDLPAMIARSTMVVLPSYNEGVPNVLLEAMSSGKPVVATRVGGIPEVVIDGKTGILCTEKSVSSLADAMDRCLSREWDADFIACHAKQFNWQDNMKGLEDLIETAFL